jgi:GNAT superfamily N-acetyltransferase
VLPLYTAAELKASFWPDLHKFLPPYGRLILMHDEAGRLVGCGMLQQVRPDAGELKRLYVRPEAKGHKLGRAIMGARMEAATRNGVAPSFRPPARQRACIGHSRNARLAAFEVVDGGGVMIPGMTAHPRGALNPTNSNRG